MKPQRFKYPRTPHLPWSRSYTIDDIRRFSCDHFVGREVVVTEKMDGENTTLYPDHIHARSMDSGHHVSRDWVKALHGQIAHLIPEGWRLCGENMYARHSVFYKNLTSYFYLFSVWDENNRCLSWDETLEWAELLGLETPRVFYRGPWEQKWFDKFRVDTETCEGYVVRRTCAFSYRDFSHHMAKWVRHNHVRTGKHWMRGPVVPNQLRPAEPELRKQA